MPSRGEEDAPAGPGRRLDLVLREAGALAIPYWRSAERWRARALLAVIVVLNLGIVGTSIIFIYWQKTFYNALEARDWDAFIASLLWWSYTPRDGVTIGFAPALALFVVFTGYELYLRQALQIRWRGWMTERYVGQWLSDRVYLQLARTDSGTDNPDQRIAEDIRLFVDNTLTLGLGLLRSSTSLFAFVWLLWRLSPPIVLAGVVVPGYLVWIALLYAALGTWVVHLAGRRLTPLNYLQQRAEADFRFSLMRVLEHVEGIAFHGGEAEQKRELGSRFATLVANWRAIMMVTKRLTFLTSGYAQVVLVFPLAVVAPAYFAGRTSLGGVFQTSNAFVQVQNALSWIVESYPALTGWFATVERLAGFRRSARRARGATGGATVTRGERDELDLANVQLTCPNGQSLLRDVQLRVSRGERLLIKGASGTGKSTLLRAIADIWPFGSGAIRRPAGVHLFLPHRPYMPLGTLKRAVCYPMNEADYSDLEVSSALADAGLGHLTPELATTDAWERRLSAGEQQRLVLARAFLIRPQWLFLDEATSSLDPAAEARLYSLLCERLRDTTVVSIAHRHDLARFHTRVVSIEEGVLRTTPT